MIRITLPHRPWTLAMVSIIVAWLLLLGFFVCQQAHGQPVSYPVVFVSGPRPDATTRMRFAEVMFPINYDPGTHIMLLKPGATTPEVLVDAGADGAAFDPVPDFTAEHIYYAFCPNVRSRNPQRRGLPRGDCNLYKRHLASGQTTQLTHSEFTPLAEGVQTTQAWGHGTFSTGPAPLPGGKVAFTSNRNNLFPNKEFTDYNAQLFVLDEATGIQEQIGYLNLGSALHPVTMTDGRLLFSSYEGQGIRDGSLRSRLWALWLIRPDGTQWEPAWSAYHFPLASHWHGQKSDGKLVSAIYYNQKKFGYGGLVQFPYFSLNSLIPFMRFGSPNPLNNPALKLGARTTWRWSFQPGGMTALATFAEPADFPSPVVNGQHVGALSQPSGAPGNAVMLSWSGPTAAQGNVQPFPDAGIYLLPAGVVADHPSKLQLIINDPTRNEMQPKALVPYASIYGIPEPTTLNWLPQGWHPTLPPGTPYGLIGTSSLYKRDSAPGQGTDYFNAPSNPVNSNWYFQGADAGKYTNDDIHSIRIVVLEPTGHKDGYKMPHFSHTNERARILGEIPVRKPGAPPDPDGNPDTSFLARIPADVAFTFQVLDEKGLVLTNSQTWHQVRPGEVRHDCGGCHAHSQQGTDFARTVAGQPGYVPHDLTQEKVRSIEYVADVRPLIQQCTVCHTAGQPNGGLVLDVVALDTNNLPRDYNTLAHDPAGQYGRKAANGKPWREPNASGYIRKLQSRRSLLMWKLYDERLDGYTNAERSDDIDFVSAGCKAHEVLSEEEKALIAAAIDLGFGIGVSWQADGHKPTVALVEAANDIVLGMADAMSGLNMASVSLTHNGQPATLTSMGDGRWSAPLAAGRWKAMAMDMAGNMQIRELQVATAPPPPPQPSPGEALFTQCGMAGDWNTLTDEQKTDWQKCAEGVQP